MSAKHTTYAFLLSLVAMPVAASTASAQYAPSYVPASSTPPQASDNPWFAYRHASSLDEGLLTGQARLLHSQGLYNQLTADAFNRWQEGYSKYLDNEVQRVDTYFKVKQINAEYRAAKMPAKLTRERLDKWNSQDQPNRLNRREYNSDTGVIQWPAVLQAQVFDKQRLVLEDLFARRTAGEFGVNSAFFQQVNGGTSHMKDTLKRYLKSEEKWFTQQEYIAAQNFLSGLVQEARFAPDLDGLAAN